jgi:hypothetical protein
MIEPIRITAFDPAMRNWGMAKMLVEIAQNGGHRIELTLVDLRLVQTESLAGKTVRKSSDDLRRASEAYSAALEWALWADLLCAEVPTGAQSARAAFGNGMSVGLLAALARERPLIQVDPYEPKKIVTGRKTATKDEMIRWAVREFPDAPWIRARGKSDGKITDANEHLADACAIARAALGTEQFKQAVALRNSIARSVSQSRVTV